MIERKFRYHDDPHHFSNWCSLCHLYYCWHPEAKSKEHNHDERADHKFIPMKRDVNVQHLLIAEFLEDLRYMQVNGRRYLFSTMIMELLEKWEKRRSGATDK